LPCRHNFHATCIDTVRCSKLHWHTCICTLHSVRVTVLLSESMQAALGGQRREEQGKEGIEGGKACFKLLRRRPGWPGEEHGICARTGSTSPQFALDQSHTRAGSTSYSRCFDPERPRSREPKAACTRSVDPEHRSGRVQCMRSPSSQHHDSRQQGTCEQLLPQGQLVASKNVVNVEIVPAD
jgi:hypothetical protein